MSWLDTFYASSGEKLSAPWTGLLLTGQECSGVLASVLSVMVEPKPPWVAGRRLDPMWGLYDFEKAKPMVEVETIWLG